MAQGRLTTSIKAIIVCVLACATGAAAATVSEAGGECAHCHTIQSDRAATTTSHAVVLDCKSCHDDRKPGRVGNRHRSIPNCVDCHDQPTHPARKKRRSARATTRSCLACHDVHGSPNLSLVATDLFWRRRVTGVLFTSEEGASPTGFTHPDAPGTGLCETCHRKTDFYRGKGSSKPHFTDRCTLCHSHDAAFGVVISPESCGVCHGDEVARLAMPSKHSGLPCAKCHTQVAAAPGPGHEASEPCSACHADSATHAPGGVGMPCMQCHDPHGSANTELVREMLTTTAGTDVPIRFDNRDGRVDGSFASASMPGTGICEVCHTTTRFYRADGMGEDHFTFSCFPCHLHGNGFEPQQ